MTAGSLLFVRGARSLLLLVLAALLVSACGSSSASSPLDSALSYFPKDSPFVMSVATDPNSSAVRGAQAMIGRVGFVHFGEEALISRLQQAGINYDTDIRPLFGNPVMIGLEGPSVSGTTRNKVLIVWVTKDAGTLSTLIGKLHLTKTGTHDGATLYQSSSATFAVDGATFLGAPSASLVTGALDRKAANQGLTSSDYNRYLGNLPKDSLIEAFGNLVPVLSAPRAAKARAVPWVAALKGYGVSVSANSGGLTFRYTLDTGGATLSASQLPLSPGSSPPGLAGDEPIQVGLRQPAAAINFLLDAMRRTNPARYGRDLAQIAAAQRRTGVSFNRDVLGQIGGNAAIESTGHSTIVRVDVVNPAVAAQTLGKLGTSALDIFGNHAGAYVTRGPGGFETVHSAHGKTVVFGLVGSEFVAGNASQARLRAFAMAPAAAAPGAQGAAAFRIALPQLLQLALRRAPSPTIQQVLSSLGDITGWISSSSGALTGSATLAIK